MGRKAKFFSIAEYGPKAVKQRNGEALAEKDKPRVMEKHTKSKGWYTLIAAIELSTDQITHFYTQKKDTNEMILLFHLLIAQYRDEEKLHLSWDSLACHFSKKLKEEIEILNSADYRDKPFTRY